ncbi:ABC transporter transmembrane domain-containing protein [Azospirillum picis]|uniref:ABC transport system ATP-binding protein n=1 Tax=Azospirillum picis TaxID=488438 RepID=A0ABU0MQK4_9PROT|nr:ABC transporter transmembrane domain-containing protein [Azospirillum picis]MBP2302161.1 putative ABC transport system ATP-binding protein [Azospirillum picis]MDQ0535740.1 putative ABC transport system ATP-binding protein [Azospirillum picis]
MNRNIFHFIWEHSGRQQIVLALLTIASFPVLYASLELPKIIINRAISDPQPERDILGFSLGPVSYLLVLCVGFLALVLANGAFKMRINTYKGVVGERQVRRLRYILLERMLRFPLPHFSKVSQGELISTITAETEPLAGFIGDSFAQPLYQGGTMLTILLFLFIQQPTIGLVSVALIPVQAYIIPKLQIKVKQLGKERVKKVRQLSERIGESVENVREIRVNGTVRYSMAEFTQFLGSIYWIRLEIYKRKYFVKFLNNFINQITPFFLFSIGGYLVLQGDLTIGALVAALSAFKDLTAPWKELLDYYQNMIDAQIKYEQISDQFSPPFLFDWHPATPQTPTDLRAPLRLEAVSWANEYGDRMLNRLSLEVPAGAMVGIAGTNALALRRLAELLVRLSPPTSGRIQIGSLPLDEVPLELLGKRMAYASPEPRMFNGSMMQNITYGLRHRPPPDDPATMSPARRREIIEAEASGNSTDSMDGIWTDFAMIGASDWKSLRPWFMQCLAATGGEAQVYQRGLREVFDPDDYPFVAEPLLRARHWLRDAIAERGLEHLLARFDRDRFNPYASLAENMLFGLPDGKRLTVARMVTDPAIRALMEAHGLWDAAVRIGRRFAMRVVSVYRGSADGDVMIMRYPHMDDALFEELVEAVTRLKRRSERPQRRHQEADTLLFATMFLMIVPKRDGADFVQPAEREAIMTIRRRLLDELPQELRDKVAVFEPDLYHPRLNVMDNLLFGRITSEDPRAITQLRALVDEALERTDARAFVLILVALGEVGIGGSLLPISVRQRIQLIRGLMKKPDIFVIYQALNSYDPEERMRIFLRMKELLPTMTLIVLEERIGDNPAYDAIYDLEEGRLVRRGQQGAAPDEDTVAGEAGDTDEPALRLLSRSSVFSDLPERVLRRLLAGADWRNVAEGDFIYRSGEPSEFVFVLADGEAEQVRLMPDGQPPLHIAFIKPPEVFGELELLAGVRRFSTIRARTHLRLLRIDGATIQHLMPSVPDLPMRVIQQVGKRLTSEAPP